MVERQQGRAPWASLCPAWPRCPPGTCPRSPGLPARAPPPPGWGWSPSHSGGWHKLAPAVQIQPVCIVETLSSLPAKCRGMAGSLELLYICASSQDLQWVCEWVLNIDIQPELLSSLGCAYLNLCFMIAGGCPLAERQICTRIIQNSFAHSLEILRWCTDWLNLDCGCQLVPASWAGWRPAPARGWRGPCWETRTSRTCSWRTPGPGWAEGCSGSTTMLPLNHLPSDTKTFQ